MSDWKDRAQQVIQEASMQAYKQANSKPGKKHRPYTLPLWIGDLISAMNTDDEEKAKAIFNYQYLRDY